MATRSKTNWKLDSQGEYPRQLGWKLDQNGKYVQHKFRLGSDLKAAEQRDKRLQAFWNRIEETHVGDDRPTWNSFTLAVAKRIADGETQIVVERSSSDSEEAYQPTAETARAHLRNAVEIMLCREPVQGNAALTRLFDEVKSEYFPNTIEEALTHFRRGPLARAKDSLIRNFMVGITKAYFFDNKPFLELRRMRAAVGAIIEMHRDRAEKVIVDDLVELIRPMPDDKLWMIIAFTCKLTAVWEALGPAIQGKVKAYIANAPDKDQMLRPATGAALDMSDLRDEALKRIGKMPSGDFAAIVADHPEEIFCDRAVEVFQAVNGFRWAEEYGRTVILPLAKYMTPAHIAAVAEAVKINGQIHGAGGTQEIICEFFDRVADRFDTNKKDWQGLLQHLLELDSRESLGVSHKYAALQARMESAGIWPVPVQ